MKAVIQRVTQASVVVKDQHVAKIGQGLLVLLGIGTTDTEADCEYLIKKIINLRIFQDEQDKMNKSVQDINGDLLLVSQFTLYASTQKGNRPSFTQAMQPEAAEALFNTFIQKCKNVYPKVQTGVFGAYMQVALCNDGPVTIIIESKLKD